jgi:hypothetical protein
MVTQAAYLPGLTQSFEVLPSAARTATVNAEIPTEAYSGAIFVIDADADPAAASITPHIEGYDPTTGSWYTILTGSAIASVSTVVLRAFPGATAAANLVANDYLPDRIRFRMAVADTDSITYQVGAILLP